MEAVETLSGGIVNPDIETLLAVQEDDRVIRDLESRLAALEPRLRALEGERSAVESRLTAARTAVETEEEKQGEIQRRLNEHQQLHDRSVAQLETVRTQREASAAMSQVEQVKRFVTDERSELDALQRRIADLRQGMEAHEASLAEIAERQEAERAAIAEQRRALEDELRMAKMKREGAARRVPRPLLAKYDRIQVRRSDDAMFPLRGSSCGNCDTSLPLQRRSQMARTGAIEMCEGCGVLLYVREG